MTLKVGDVVRLNSGGPDMTVLAVDETGVLCTWFNGHDGHWNRVTDGFITGILSLGSQVAASHFQGGDSGVNLADPLPKVCPSCGGSQGVHNPECHSQRHIHF
jgi:uncharacterized protein YodC (DUF2158 family)